MKIAHFNTWFPQICKLLQGQGKLKEFHFESDSLVNCMDMKGVGSVEWCVMKLNDKLMLGLQENHFPNQFIYKVCDLLKAYIYVWRAWLKDIIRTCLFNYYWFIQLGKFYVCQGKVRGIKNLRLWQPFSRSLFF